MARRKRRKKIEPIRFKKFAGNICERLPEDNLLDDLREGDYIIYWDNGYRVGKVQKNHRGYKHRWIKIYASVWNGHVLSRAKKIKPKKVKSGWRKVEDEQIN
tara:strand:+ start:477 stop:782 length:306 start_codon:yes stop_codon:yes gene_type:complete